MRQSEILVIAVKIVGLLVLLDGLSLLVTIPFSYEAATDQGFSPVTSVISASMYVFVHFLFGAILLFRTPSIVGLIATAPTSSEHIAAISFSQAIQILGLYLTISGLSEFTDIAEWLFYAESTPIMRASLWYSPVVYFASGLLLLFKPHLITSALPNNGGVDNKQPKPTP